MHDVQAFTFRREELFPIADRLRADFLDAKPFRHVVIDDFLPPSVLEPVLSEFPEPRDASWQRFDDAREIKLALADTEKMGPATRALLAEFNGGVFVEFLERLTGIKHLVSDPHLEGGGLHQIRPGGFLKVHADFNKSRRLNLDRRLNGLLYLNKDWEESYGGHLQLWSKDMTVCEHKILPVFNRFVLFATTDDANHGHPDPLTCPEDRARRSMALYYYTNGRPEEEVTEDHTTLFKERPGETWKFNARQVAKRWTPPAIVELFGRDRGK
ncbi:2OG-Fe(II) oxygenase [Microbispora sp. NEAU-D428]|uniref:2OG-Fe(II) oxygenase n=1 Tax=Microbispora sitophila TaxID=2771537 RepID=UPI0018690C50|nr:2OG-Fe(II) oxygenase [Microbispora sitophila]MBE3012335.1 2OG-Fe(II) oxygenase [Microbispora sitophila]